MGELLASLSNPFGLSKSSVNIRNILTKSKSFINKLINNKNGHLIFSSSISQINFNLCNFLSMNHSDEIVLCNFSNDSFIKYFENIQNINIKYWCIKEDKTIIYKNFFDLINEKTKLVVIPHVNNIIGSIINIKEIINHIKLINSNTKVYVDGTAYLPHRNVDVYSNNSDFYAFSFQKFLGFKISVLYIKNDSSFKYDTFDNLMIGGIQYELLSSILSVEAYLKNVVTTDNILSKSRISNCYLYFITHENNLVKYFIDNFNKISCNPVNKNYKSILDIEYTPYICNKIDIELLTDITKTLVPIFSIYSKSIDLDKIYMFLALLGIETSVGNFNCTTLLNYMNINKVLRISLFHYNFKKELIIFFTRLIEFVPNSNIDIFNFQKMTINFTHTIKKSFDNLSIDNYYNDIRYRSFSLIDTNNWITIGHPIFYNNYCENNNNMNYKINEYTHISNDVLKDDFLKI